MQVTVHLTADDLKSFERRVFSGKATDSKSTVFRWVSLFALWVAIGFAVAYANRVAFNRSDSVLVTFGPAII